MNYLVVVLVSTIRVTWLLRLRILYARPWGAGNILFNVLAPSTNTVFTIRLASSALSFSFFCFQLLIALNNNLCKGVAECCGWYSKKANAFSTSTPRISSASKRILRGDVG